MTTTTAAPPGAHGPENCPDCGTLHMPASMHYARPDPEAPGSIVITYGGARIVAAEGPASGAPLHLDDVHAQRLSRTQRAALVPRLAAVLAELTAGRLDETCQRYPCMEPPTTDRTGDDGVTWRYCQPHAEEHDALLDVHR